MPPSERMSEGDLSEGTTLSFISLEAVPGVEVRSTSAPFLSEDEDRLLVRLASSLGADSDPFAFPAFKFAR